jgi:hypothetical protein
MRRKGIGIIQRILSMPKNHKLIVFHNHEFVATQVTNCEVGEKV